MEKAFPSVEDFFRQFELNNNKSDFSAAVSQFADTFMAAGPQGAQCVKASDFALALPKRKQLFESFGCRSMQLVSVDAHSLGDRYRMAHTRWKMNFAEGDLSAEAVFVDSTFIVETTEQQFRIVLYLAHQDVMAILKERGPAKG
ncbi:MAG TPA: hypothetical protein VMR02_21155 [Terracidiphilus sp.]|jgi:hypothetical protein|nr:hypothetical protein [Terracidiphilus sp.]